MNSGSLQRHCPDGQLNVFLCSPDGFMSHFGWNDHRLSWLFTASFERPARRASGLPRGRSVPAATHQRSYGLDAAAFSNPQSTPFLRKDESATLRNSFNFRFRRCALAHSLYSSHQDYQGGEANDLVAVPSKSANMMSHERGSSNKGAGPVREC